MCMWPCIAIWETPGTVFKERHKVYFKAAIYFAVPNTELQQSLHVLQCILCLMVIFQMPHVVSHIYTQHAWYRFHTLDFGLPQEWQSLWDGYSGKQPLRTPRLCLLQHTRFQTNCLFHLIECIVSKTKGPHYDSTYLLSIDNPWKGLVKFLQTIMYLRPPTSKFKFYNFGVL